MLQFGPKIKWVTLIIWNSFGTHIYKGNTCHKLSQLEMSYTGCSQLTYTGGHVSAITKTNIQLEYCHLVQTLSE